MKRFTYPVPNTFGIDSYASAHYIIKREADLLELFENRQIDDFLVLGEGSNILPASHLDTNLITIAMDDMKVSEEGESVRLRVGAGKNWDKFVRTCAKSGFHGMENLALIPGKLGAAPVQNIGAYGVEQDAYLSSVRGYHIDKKAFTKLSKEECRFSYRDSIFKQELKNIFIITEVEYVLKRDFKPELSYGGVKEYLDEHHPDGFTPIELVDAISAIRRGKLPYPDELGNSGSFFKNPILSSNQLNTLLEKAPEAKYFPHGSDYKVSAAWLIESCGWKGKRFGDAGVYDKHALIIVNHGSATGEELFDLSSKIIESVKAIYDIELEREVNLLGF